MDASGATIVEQYAELVERYWLAAQARDWETFGRLVDPGVLYEVPQTRERVRGREGYLDFNATYPGEWTLEIEEIVADERRAVSRVSFDVDGETATGITFFEFRDGLISRITDYWPEAYDPPARMSRFVERY